MDAGRKISQVLQSGGSPGHKERQEGVGTHRDKHKENTSPRLLVRKMRGADLCEFLQPGGLKD